MCITYKIYFKFKMDIGIRKILNRRKTINKTNMKHSGYEQFIVLKPFIDADSAFYKDSAMINKISELRNLNW